MSDDDQLIERALNASSACLLPSLSQDLDTQPVALDDFKEFQIMLNDQLHLLLDILYQNRNLLSDEVYDNQLVQLRVNLLLLACEQTEPNPFFQTDQKIILASLEMLIRDNIKSFDEVVIRKAIQTYKDGLRKNSWKKQLGMIHGFPKFCKTLLELLPKEVDADLMMFILSVGSNLVTHFDPHYKTIGMRIYRQLVELGDKALLKELNIHQVIYSECIEMTRKSSDIEYNDHLYECLFHAVAIEDAIVENSKWCKFDDVIENLLSQFGMESAAEVSYLLLSKIVKFCGISQHELFEVFSSLSADQLDSGYAELRIKAKDENLRTMRWVKNLFQMMIRESPRLLSSPKESFRILQAFHAIYIISVSTIDESILGQQLEDFTRKFLVVLMQVSRTFCHDRDIVTSVILFLKTISLHQSRSRDLIDKILAHDTFK